MNLTVQIPDELARRLSATEADLSRRAFEALAAEAWRHDRLIRPELQQLLGIQSSCELDGFLKAHDIMIDPGSFVRSAFDAEKARAAGVRIRALRKGVRLDRQGMSIRDLAHLGHKY